MRKLFWVTRKCNIYNAKGKHLGYGVFFRSVEDDGSLSPVGWRPMENEGTYQLKITWSLDECKDHLVKREYTWKWGEVEKVYVDIMNASK